MTSTFEDLPELHTCRYETRVVLDGDTPNVVGVVRGDTPNVVGVVQDTKPAGLYVADDPEPLENLGRPTEAWRSPTTTS